MRLTIAALALCVLPVSAGAQAGKFPPDSLVNTQVIPKGTPVTQVIGQMRNYVGALGVRCVYCHVGEDGPLDQVDFASDDKRTKLVARQMMRMVQEINRRLDSLPERPTPGVTVTCQTCHRGVARPVSLASLVSSTAIASGADSAIKAYRALRTRFYGRDAYDFGEPSLNAAALATGRAGKHDDALALLEVNAEIFPAAASPFITRGNVLLLKGDTTAAADAFRAAIAKDANNQEARGRLRDIGRVP